MTTPYLDLNRNCQYLHNFKDEDVEKFVKIGKLNKGMVVLDAMCGDGAVSKIISREKGIKLLLLDNAKFQLKKAKQNIKNVEFVLSSILKTEFKNNTFDRVFIRSAVYEVPKDKQPILYKEIFRIINPKGYFINWTWKLNEENKGFLNNIARVKDNIAGFDELVKNRYFMSEKELTRDLEEAGFKEVKSKDLGIFYTISTKRWSEVDFKGDKQKLEKYNAFIRETASKMPHKGIEINDLGEDIQIIVPALITLARKK